MNRTAGVRLAGGAPWRLLRGGAFAFAYVLLLLPTLIVIPISFDASGVISFPPRAWSFKLYADLLSDPSWASAARRSAMVATASTALAVAFGAPVAYLVGRGHVGRGAWINGLFLGPLVMPTVVTALGFYIVVSSLSEVGPLVALIIAHAALVMPFVYATISAGLRQVDQTAETAARLMGAGPMRILLQVVLPQIKYSIVAGAVLAFLFSFDEAVIATFILDAHNETLPVKMYSSIKWEISPLLPAVSTLLTCLSLLVGCIAIATRRSGDEF